MKPKRKMEKLRVKIRNRYLCVNEVQVNTRNPCSVGIPCSLKPCCCQKDQYFLYLPNIVFSLIIPLSTSSVPFQRLWGKVKSHLQQVDNLESFHHYWFWVRTRMTSHLLDNFQFEASGFSLLLFHFYLARSLDRTLRPK